MRPGAGKEALGGGLALAVGMAGAGLFWAVGFPAAPLTGAAAAVSLAALFGLRMAMPSWLATVTFVFLGINIGSGVTPEALEAAITWPLSLVVLGGCLVLGMLVTQWGLTRWMGFARREATLAAAPGHMSYVMSIALQKDMDVAQIVVIQSIRVLFLTLVVPVLVTLMFGAGVPVHLDRPEVMGLGALAGLALLAGGLGFGFQRLRLPAAFLLAGMAVSAAAHAMSLVPGRMPPGLVFVGLAILGTLIGTRFVGRSWADLRRGLAAGLWVTGMNMAMVLVAMAVAMRALELPPALLVVGYAPGGVEAMAAMALALGLNPAFVAAHHVMRLALLTVVLPWMLRRSSAARAPEG